MTTTIKKVYSAPESQLYTLVTERVMALSSEISIKDDIEVDASTSFLNDKSRDSMNWTNHPTD